MENVSLNIKTADFAKYLVPQDVEFYISFDQVPFVNEINGNIVANFGTSQSNLVKGVHGFAGKIVPNSKFSLPINFVDKKQFTLSFWLISSYIKPQINKNTNLKSFYRMAIFDKALFTYDNNTNIIETNNGSFVFFEECRDDNQNVLMILLKGSDGTTALLETPSYSVNKLHHFWFAYDGNSRSLRCYVDGKKLDLINTIGNQIPKEIFNNPILPFNINNSAVGNANLLRNNSCILDDLVFINRCITSDFIISNVINYGAKYIVSDKYRYRDNKHNLLCFDDPGTITVNAIVSNGKKIYAAKSNGSVYRGEQLIWQSKLDLSIPDDAMRIMSNIKKNDADSFVDYTADGLSIYKSDLRF